MKLMAVSVVVLAGWLSMGCARTGSTRVVDVAPQSEAPGSGRSGSPERNPDWVVTPTWAARGVEGGEAGMAERLGPMPACVAISVVRIESADERSWAPFESALARHRIDVKPGQSAVLPRWTGRTLRDSARKIDSVRTSPEIGMVIGRAGEFGAWIGAEGVPGDVGFFRAEQITARDCELRLSIQAARRGSDGSAERGKPSLCRIDDRATLKPGEWYLSVAEASESGRRMAVLLEMLEVWPDGMPVASAEGAAIHGVARRVD